MRASPALGAFRSASAVHRKERKRLCTPWSSFLPSTRHNLTGIDPRHRRHHLLLLPSGPDKVRECLLRGGRSERPVSGAKPLRGNSAPRKADFGYRAPLAPRLAQPSFYTPEWFRFSRGKEDILPALRFTEPSSSLILTPSRQHHKKMFLNGSLIPCRKRRACSIPGAGRLPGSGACPIPTGPEDRIGFQPAVKEI